jgi:peptide/nickel transport system substrate-binding protein
MRSSKKFGLAAAVLAGALSLTACNAGAGSTASQEAQQDSVTVALTGEPVNLDFTTTAGAAIPQALMSNVYEGLVEIDQEGKIQPLLAESWELSEDRKTTRSSCARGRISPTASRSRPRT